MELHGFHHTKAIREIQYHTQMNIAVDFKLTKYHTPNFNGANYLVIVLIGNRHSYAFSYWDGEIWEEESEDKKVIAFTNTSPDGIVKILELKTN